MPSGTQNGDVLIAQVGCTGGTGATITPPSGWTLIRSDDSTTVIKMSLYYRIASSEPASYNWTVDTTRSIIGNMTGYSGCEVTASPIDANGGQSNASSTSITAPSITTTVADPSHAGFFATGTVAFMTFTPPSGMTERYDANTTESASVSQASAGSTGD